MFVKIVPLLLFIFGFLGLATADLPKTILSIAGGTNSGTYLQVSKTFCNLINESNEEKTIRCLTRTSAGSEENINIVLKDKTAIGIVQADVLNNHERKSDLRILAKIYEEPIIILASKNSNLKNFDEIILQKRINIGSSNSGENKTAKLIMKAKNWQTPELLQIGRYDITSLFCKNAIDVSFFVEHIKSDFIENIAKKCLTSFVSINEDFIKSFTSQNQEFFEFIIPSHSYANQHSEVKTLAVSSYIIASKEASTDLIYKILVAIFGNIKKLQNTNSLFIGKDINSFFPKDKNKLSIPLHSGTEKFLKEIEQN